ncbi:MAG TPA: 2-oxo acid dehydrogenase subunit E2 [Anaerolineales bacterium]|nr:2-oxo acid dehydrogenase subunit E2 [Anaerolineales bacterium]
MKLSPERQFMLNILALPRPVHPMFGLLEVDVTAVRSFITEHRSRSGENLSFTGYIAFCLARAVEEHKEVQAYRQGNRHFAFFEEVDVGLMVERQVGDKKELTGHVIRDASHKTYREIHEEIRSAQSPGSDTSKEAPGWFLAVLQHSGIFSKLIFKILGWVIKRNPAIPVSINGTVGITAVGMFSKGHSGWGFETTLHSLDLVVGSIAWKPVVIDGNIVPREILNLTVVFNHDIIDGGPATRFTRRLIELIEGGYGLDEEIARTDL